MPRLKAYATAVTAPEQKAKDASEKYAKLRENIVAAGIPLLTDAELRREIRERKGTARGIKN